MKNSVLSGVLGPSRRDLAQGEFSFFSFAMIVCAQEVAPASFLIELTSVSWGIDSDAGNGCLAEKVLGRT